MDMQIKLEINALIDRLVADGETFSREDGRRLIDLVPLTGKPSRLEMALSAMFPGLRMKGRTTTGHDEAIDDEIKKKEISFGEGEYFRAGQYKLLHWAGHIEIDQPFNDTRLDAGDERAAMLLYDPASRQPLELQILKSTPWKFGPFLLVKSDFVFWKRPASA